jgi:hypothetical protein
MYLAVQRNDKTMAHRIEPEASMGEKELESADVERLCQAVSPNDEPCDFPATVHCAECGRWFCDAHAEDEEWHSCMLPPGEVGGEG